VRDGRIIKEEIPRNTPNGMQGLVFNMRREKFQDIAVRKALNLAFDYEWANKNLFYGIYTRSETYFTNSDFASSGLPTEAELALLEPYRNQLPEEVFTTPYSAPKTDGSGNNRENLKKSADLLKEAGYRLEKGVLLDKAGKPFTIEFLLNSTSFERVLGQYFKNLKKLGISGSIRIVDAAQYIKRVEVFDFDVMVGIYPQSSSPGNEQISFWHSSKADEPGSRNLIGIKNPVVDALVEKLVSSPDKASLVAACRALDRVLLNQHYLIPNWHSRFYRALYWNKFGKPAIAPKYSIGFDSWWVKG
jgi:microcin C transport system substrate-binding protein